MNDPVFFAIVIGIVSGIATAMLIWIFRILWLKVFSPILERYFYNSVLIDGTWNGVKEYISKLPSGEKKQVRHFTLNVQQQGNKISGTFYARSEYKDAAGNIDKTREEYSNQYKVSGEIKDNYLILNYSPLSKNRTGLGSFVLKITHGGTKLNGSIAFLAEGTENIQSISDIILNRSI